ncbi:MAG: two-component system OmpR family sensor kinase [Sulfurimonas sp.]|jgi:two-component system OmpR family sensor kinase|uniref:sensor histidine kinase n=1 Tax=Sulfurimonas sp. TaxID=2022749 RepID=UPI0039E5D890
MRVNEKKSLFRFILIYLTISLLLFISLAYYYYDDQKRLIEDSLALEMSLYGGEFRDLGKEKFPEGFEVKVLQKDSYPYPAFIKNKDSYISTSCGGFDYQSKIIVIEAKPSILQKRVKELKEKLYYFMGIAFIVNFFISIFLSWISLRPVRESNLEFRRFLDDVIHDLNAPISAIDINLENLANKYEDKQIIRISRSVETIKNLYLNLEVLLQKRHKNIVEPVNISKACEHIVYQLQPLFPNVCFKLNVPDLIVNVNSFVFERILVNLVENAAKYTKEKPIVTLGIDEKQRFYVKDNGPGMHTPNDFLERSVQSSTKNSGYGLGLSIVKRLSDECGIKLSIESRIDEGTIIYFDISKQIIES